MTEKIKVVAYSRHRENVFSDHINKMPIHITHELNGEYEEVDCRFFSFLWRILRHASDIDVLVFDGMSGSCKCLGRLYRWLNPLGKLATLQSIDDLLKREKSFSADWQEEDYRLWVNQVLLPAIGFVPLAQMWRSYSVSSI